MIYGRIVLGEVGAAGGTLPPPDLEAFHGARPLPVPGRTTPSTPAAEVRRGGIELGYLPDGVPSLDAAAGLHADSRGAAVVQGHLTGIGGLRRDLEAAGYPQAADCGAAQLILAGLRAFGEELPARLTGAAAFAATDAERRLTLICRDRLGVEPLFFCERPGSVIFCSRATGVAGAGPGRRLDGGALREFLLLGYLVSEPTLFAGVRRLPGGVVLVVKAGASSRRTYWSPAPGLAPVSREEAIDNLRTLMTAAVEECLPLSGPTGILLSGGLDSSAVTALSRQLLGAERQLSTFSFRCAGASYDESHYAGVVARAFATDHHLVDYGAGQVEAITGVAGAMDEPFCDIGINLATWILAGAAAAAGTEVLLTGDGGDELFCGHPVYAAERLARRLRLLPGPLLGAAVRPFTWLPDSEAKKDLKVKLQRFALGLQHPSDLGPSRWRFHSRPAAIERLLGPAAPPAGGGDPYGGIRAALAGVPSSVPDEDARVVLADYRIVVEFYLRRLILARRFGLEARLPWLDHRLVEAAAALPAAWRVHGLKDEKVLMKPIIEPWLPREVVHRGDKLGHSVPFKNWLRQSPEVRGLMDRIIGEASLARRGLFDPGAVARLRAAHDGGRANHSHRLWALTVLELWLRGNIQ